MLIRTINLNRLIPVAIFILLLSSVLLARVLQPESQPVTTTPGQPAVTDYIDDYVRGPEITASSAMLLDNTTGTVLFAKDEHKPRPIASTTKVMTAIIAIENGNMKDTVTVSRKAASTRGSDADLKTGETLTLRQLMYGLLLRSGNDAAVAIAEHIAGSESAFVDMMNVRARELGIRNTHFVTPHGMDAPGQYSTAFDLAVLSSLAMLYPSFAEFVSTREYKFTHGADVTRLWRNTNRLLWAFSGAEGIKTGTTDGAGDCLIAAATRGARQLITVVLNSRDRYADTTALLEYGFQAFDLLVLAPRNKALANLALENGMSRHVPVGAGQTLARVFRHEDIPYIRTQMTLKELRAPVPRGTTAGTLTVFNRNQKIDSIGLISLKTVHRRTPVRLLIRWLQGLWT